MSDGAFGNVKFYSIFRSNSLFVYTRTGNLFNTLLIAAKYAISIGLNTSCDSF